MPAIQSTANAAANQVNIAAIDQLVGATRFRHIVAWGKWLGFTPETVKSCVEAAELENAPADAIQKIDGRWLRCEDIVNEDNRRRVQEIAGTPLLI